jgi:hypothetical protein
MQTGSACSKPEHAASSKAQPVDLKPLGRSTRRAGSKLGREAGLLTAGDKTYRERRKVMRPKNTPAILTTTGIKRL